MDRRLAGLALPAAILVLLATAPEPVAGSCMEPPPIGEAIGKAELAFVGRVVRVANMDRWATVAVEEVWVGPDLPVMVEIRGGPEPGTMSSVDRAFDAGMRYLFFPYAQDSTLHDNACSSTTSWADELVRLRPSTARPPVGAPPEEPTAAFDPASLVVPAAIMVGVGALVFGAAFAVRGKA